MHLLHASKNTNKKQTQPEHLYGSISATEDLEHYISGTESQQELLSNILNSFHTCAEEAKTDKPLYVQGQKYSL